MSDFSSHDIPLVPAALYGVRSFRVNDSGFLGPIHQDRNFTYESAVNRAKCAAGVYSYLVIGAQTVRTVDPQPLHSAPDIDCSCGFYAYFDQDIDQSMVQLELRDQIVGIVRATGRCIVGDLGFRAEKVEIVALVSDQFASAEVDSARVPIGERILRVGDKLNAALLDKIESRHIVALSLLYWAWYFLAMLLPEPYKMFAVAACLAFVPAMLTVLFGSYTKAHRSSQRLAAMLQRVHSISPSQIQAIKKNYPDAQLFATLEQAKKEFPLSKIEELPQWMSTPHS